MIKKHLNSYKFQQELYCANNSSGPITKFVIYLFYFPLHTYVK